jgi:AcrR family transcriptional regulator
MKVNDKNIEERILERTASLIGRMGLKGWNMDTLASEVGLAKNTLYKIIGSKEELVERVAKRNIRSVQTRLVEIIEGEGEYLDVLKGMTEEFPRLLNAVGADSMRDIFLEYPAVEKAVRVHQDEMTGRVLGFIETGIERGILRGDVTAGFVFDLLRAIVIFHIGSGSVGDELGKRIGLSLDCLFNGLKA